MRTLPFDLDDLRAFVTVVETGGFGRAAAQLSAAKSVLSRRVSALEFALGAQLLARDRRGARATEAGLAFYPTAADVLSRLEQARDDALAATTALAGPIAIAAPLTFGTLHLAPVLARFAASHPDVRLDVSLDDRIVDLVGGGFDLGIRIGSASPAPLATRRLATVRAALLASPAYLARRGRPSAPAELAGHDVLDYANLGFDPWRAAFGPVVGLERLAVVMRANNGEVLRAAAVAGLGLVMLPAFIAAAAVAAGELEAVLPDHPLPAPALYAVSPPGRPALRRVRALIEHLAATFGVDVLA